MDQNNRDHGGNSWSDLKSPPIFLALQWPSAGEWIRGSCTWPVQLRTNHWERTQRSPRNVTQVTDFMGTESGHEMTRTADILCRSACPNSERAETGISNKRGTRKSSSKARIAAYLLMIVAMAERGGFEPPVGVLAPTTV